MANKETQKAQEKLLKKFQVGTASDNLMAYATAYATAYASSLSTDEAEAQKDDSGSEEETRDS